MTKKGPINSRFSPCPPNLPLDGLIVLGAKLNPRGEPGRVARLRLTHGMQIWREHCPQGFVLLTGGVGPGCRCSEARSMAHWALRQAEAQWGVTVREALGACLVLEEASKNTAASAIHTLPLVQARGPGAVGLVTDAVHIHRAHLLFKRRFTLHGIRVVPLPARGLVRHYWRNRRYLWLTKMALREGGAWLKVFANLARGRP
jgi:uncharacterized SAM-binding protein YcdF (DUF218 family)